MICVKIPRSSRRYELIPPTLRSAALRKFVAEQAATPNGEYGGGLERGHLIRPIGAVLKLIHCDHAEDKTGPKFEASFEVNCIGGEERVCLLVWQISTRI